MSRHMFKARPQLSKSILAALILALFAVPAVYIESAAGWLPALSLIYMWLLSFLYVRYLAHGITFSEEAFLEGCTRGTDVEFCVLVKNVSRLLCADAEVVLYISDAFGAVASEEAVRCALSPGEERGLTFTVRFEHVGEYSVGIKRLKLRGFFGILPLVFENTEEHKITVLPRAHPLNRLSLSDRSRDESMRAYTQSSIESVDYAGVREYVFGDPIKLIHWKLSSHSGGYVTKLLESYGNNGITIIPGLHAPKYPAEALMGVYDAIMEACFSLCLYAGERGLDTELVFIGRNGEKHVFAPSDTGGFAVAMRNMPVLHTEYDRTFDSTELLRGNESVYMHSNIALCVASVDEALVQKLLSLRRARKNPILFFILPDLVYGDERRFALKPLALLENAGMPCFIISSADEIGKAVNR